MTDIRQETLRLEPYVAPSISTLSEEHILEELGPARAYTGTVPFNF